MGKRKTTIITSETHEVLIIERSLAPALPMWCPVCAEELEMLKPEQAAAVANVNTRTIYAWVESGRIHHLETAGGELMICPRQSLRE